MRLVHYDLPRGGAARDVTSPGGERGGRWVQLGVQVLRLTPDGLGEARIGGTVRATRMVPDSYDDRLRLVVQNGRLFQQEHPEVPVVLDHGRLLLVELTPAAAAAIGRGRRTCYTILPVPWDTVVLEARAGASSTRRAALDWVRALAAAVTAESLRPDLTHLAGLHSRHSATAGFTAAVTWAEGRFREMGWSAAREPIDTPEGPSENVLAERPGEGPVPRGLVLVTAHLDSVNARAGPDGEAPGADDNASGAAGVLAVAAALRQHRARDDLRLVLFGGEEQGLHGSEQHVARLSAAERARVRAVVNMDMVASLNTPAPGVLLEGAPVSRSVVDALAAAAAAYTTLEVQISLAAANSDHVPFIEAGLPAVLTIEGADSANERIHSPADRLETLDLDLAVQIVRMNVACVAETLGRAGDETR